MRAKKQKKDGQKITPCEVVSPIKPDALPIAVEAIKAREDIRNVLVKYDKLRAVNSPGDERRALADVWDECWKYNDTNELVRQTFCQVTTVFSNAWEKFFQDRVHEEEYIMALKKEIESGTLDDKQMKLKLETYYREMDHADARRNTDVKQMTMLAAAIKDLASEYRQCRTQQAYFFHISQVQQFMALIVALVHQHVTDLTIVEKISKALEDASAKIFPLSVNQDS